MKMLSPYYVCCIPVYSNALKKISAIKVYKQMIEQTMVVNGGVNVKNLGSLGIATYVVCTMLYCFRCIRRFELICIYLVRKLKLVHV